MDKYTMNERTIAQNKTFELRRKGYKATRIMKTVQIGLDKNNKPISEQVLTFFGYSNDRKILKEINENDVEKCNFEFIYLN